MSENTQKRLQQRAPDGGGSLRRLLIKGTPRHGMAESFAWGLVKNELHLLPALVCGQCLGLWVIR